MDNLKKIIRLVNQAFSENNMQAFVDLCSEGITWTMAGDKTISGKQNIMNYMASMTVDGFPVLTEGEILVEDNRAASTGTMQMLNKDGSYYHGSFCDIYKFEHGKIASITTYVVHGQTR